MDSLYMKSKGASSEIIPGEPVGTRMKNRLGFAATQTRYGLSTKATLLLMALPSFAFVLVFAYGPIFGWLYAFFDYRVGMPLSKVEFAGFKYFILAFDDPNMPRVLLNTIVISLLFLTILPLSEAFAILLSEMRSTVYRKLIQITTTLPHFISWIVVYAIFFSMLAPESGFINQFLLNAGILTEPFNPLANLKAVWPFQTFVHLWKNLGYNSIIFFAALAGIDAELYDAVHVDGAGRFRTIWHVTVPGLMPIFLVLLLINIGFILSNGFEQFWVFQNPLVSLRIEVLDLYMYKIGMLTNDVALATAMSMARTVVSVILLFIANLISKVFLQRSLF